MVSVGSSMGYAPLLASHVIYPRGLSRSGVPPRYQLLPLITFLLRCVGFVGGFRESVEIKRGIFFFRALALLHNGLAASGKLSCNWVKARRRFE